jgi:glycosyltransferase involved in cell wall biosynthesis
MSDRLRIAILVSNDLSTDQRVLKVCRTLHNWGHEPFLTGRLLPESLPMQELPFQTQRMRLFFRTGPGFYAELSFRLFFRLLFVRCDVIHANDLDTLLPAYLVSVIRRKKLIYDTHEYFTGVPELMNRPGIRKIWQAIERFIFPRLQRVMTVNDSIAKLYESEYHKRLRVVRNIPMGIKKEPLLLRIDLNLPEDRFIIILQGNGINVDRGAEEAVEMMNKLEGCLLLIAGSGDVIPFLKEQVQKNNLSDKVVFLPRMEYSKLMQITAYCDLGLTLDKDTNINYRYSLPNKLFDYIHAGIPVLASDLVEVAKIVNTYSIGWIIPIVTSENLVNTVNKIRLDTEQQLRFRANCKKAAKELSWETEVEEIRNWYA